MGLKLCQGQLMAKEAHVLLAELQKGSARLSQSSKTVFLFLSAAYLNIAGTRLQCTPATRACGPPPGHAKTVHTGVQAVSDAA